jgi:hypothetical protein
MTLDGKGDAYKRIASLHRIRNGRHLDRNQMMEGEN